MSLLTKTELTELADDARFPAVSIYLPTHRAGPEIRQDPIRLKNLLQAAAREVLARGQDEQAVQSLLAPARRLIDDDGFWRHQSDGLALFLAPDFFESFRLPVPFEELQIVGSRFHLKPLLPLLEGDGRYFVLALSQNRVRLFEGTRQSLKEVDLGESMPKSLTDAVGYDWEQRSLQFHTGTGGAAGGSGKRAAVFHGQGAGGDEEQGELEQFLRRLDSALSEALGHPSPPLLLAGAEPLLGTFRKVSDYPQLIDRAVSGNQDEATADEVHDRAWPLVEPFFRRALLESRERLSELEGTEKVSTQTPEIVLAAVDGRIDTLFVPLEARRWGTFDPASREVTVRNGEGASKGQTERSTDQDRELVDLFDLAAIEALRQGATVFAVADREMPGSGHAAAILRY